MSAWQPGQPTFTPKAHADHGRYKACGCAATHEEAVFVCDCGARYDDDPMTFPAGRFRCYDCGLAIVRMFPKGLPPVEVEA